MSDAFDKVTYHGRLMDEKTKAFVQAAEEILGYELTIVQGCYAQSVPASGTTHNGGGVLDLAPFDWRRKVKVMANLGGFPYHRTARANLWGEHIHVGIRNHGRLDPMAADQQDDWDHVPPLNGLAGHDELTGQYHPGKKINFVYPPKVVAVVPQPTNVTKARDALVDAHFDLGKAIAFMDEANPDRALIVKLKNQAKVQRAKIKNILTEMPKR